MGRFSKLETSGPSPASPEGGPAIPEGFGTRRSRAKSPDESVVPSPDYDARYYLAEGNRCFYQGECEKALRMYSRAVQAESALVEPWIGQVRCLLEMKQSREAMVWVRRALELFPEDARLISLQGMCYAVVGTVERGLACSDYALGRSGSTAADPLVWVARGAILSLAESRNADHCFAKALEVRARDDWQTPLSVGLLMIGQKKWARAAEFLETAIHVQQSNDYLWERLGWARERLGLGQSAMEAYEAALHLNPANRPAQDGVVRLGNSSVWTRAFRRLFR